MTTTVNLSGDITLTGRFVPDIAPSGAARTAPSQAPTGLQITLVRDAVSLESLAPEWNGLFERAGRPSQVFQTHAFAAQIARTYGMGLPATADVSPCPCKLAIAIARRNGELVLVWPLVETRRFGLRWLGWLGEPIAQYGDVLIDPAEPADTTLQATLDHVIDCLSPDVLRLRKVREDAVIAPLLARLGARPVNPVEAPCVTLASGGSSFEQRQNGKARKNRRRLLRRLEERGSVEFREITTTDHAHAALANALADKRDWLLRRSIVSPALGDPEVDAFMAAALADPARATGCAAFELKLDGRQIAFALGFRCKQRLMLHLITYAADAEKSGAGVLNLESILRLAEAEGLEALDLLPPKAQYKLDWADRSISVADYAMGVGIRGKAAARLLDGFAIPLARQVIDRLPQRLRHRLATRALRQVHKPSPASPE